MNDISKNDFSISKITSKQLIPENIFLHGINQLHTLKAVEIDPVDFCNHHCSWCFTEPYRNRDFMKISWLKNYLYNFKNNGGVAIHFSGGGEPLLFPPMRVPQEVLGGMTLCEYTASLGLYAGLITNGVFLSDFLKKLKSVNSLSFIRVSLDATNSQDHGRRHGCNTTDFLKIILNLENLLNYRGDSPTPAIGASFIVNPINQQFSTANELKSLAKLSKEIGLDFVQIKHIHTDNPIEANKNMEYVFRISQDLDWGHTEYWVHKYRPGLPYKVCRVARLIQVVSARNKIYPCCHLYGRKKYEVKLAKEIHNCNSLVCRYDSINKLLELIDSKDNKDFYDFYSQAIMRLDENLNKFGFHPYRLYPSAPDLFDVSSG